MMSAHVQKSGLSGDTLVKETTRGPQADKLQYDRIMGFLESARADGLNLLVGGNAEKKKGFYIEPTIIANVPEDHRVLKEEIFGPVVIINTFEDEDAVMKLANGKRNPPIETSFIQIEQFIDIFELADTEFGLYSSVFTKNISRALRVAKKFEAGMCGINCTSPAFSIDMPFGGWKGSGDGREYSQYGFDAWTELKAVIISL